MQISFLLSSLQLSGGVLLVLAYAQELAARHHPVRLIVPHGTVDESLKLDLAESVVVIESNISLPTLFRPWTLLRLAYSLAAVTPPSDVLVATHTPTVVSVLWASMVQQKGHRVWLYMDYPEMFRHRPVERFLLRTAPCFFEAITTISRPLAADVASRTSVPVLVSGCGLARKDLFYPVAGQRNQRSRRILYVGDNRPRKGFFDLLNAIPAVYKNHPDLELVIASKHKFTVESAIPHQFYLHPTDGVLADLYRGASLLVFPSWGEGLGYPPLESMACGTPVVVSDSHGVRDYAIHGENCLIVPKQDPAALAEAIEQILTNSELAERLVQNGFATVRQYDWVTAVDRFDAALQAVVTGNRQGITHLQTR